MTHFLENVNIKTYETFTWKGESYISDLCFEQHCEPISIIHAKQKGMK